MCMVFCLKVYICITCVPGTIRDQKTVLEPLELELLMVVSCHAGARNRTWVLRKNKKCS